MTELKVKCTSCGHLQRLFDYENHTFAIPAKENEAFNNWLTEHDKAVISKFMSWLCDRYEVFEPEDDGYTLYGDMKYHSKDELLKEYVTIGE